MATAPASAIPAMRRALDDLLKKLNSSFPANRAKPEDLLAILERLGQLKKAMAADDSLEAEIIESLVGRGAAWAEIDGALGVNPGRSWQRHRGNRKAREGIKEPLPGKAPNELVDELGIRSTVPIYNRLKKVGPAEWWGYFGYAPSGAVERITDPARHGEGSVRILDLDAYRAAAGKPGRKRKVVSATASDRKA